MIDGRAEGSFHVVDSSEAQRLDQLLEKRIDSLSPTGDAQLGRLRDCGAPLELARQLIPRPLEDIGKHNCYLNLKPGLPQRVCQSQRQRSFGSCPTRIQPPSRRRSSSQIRLTSAGSAAGSRRRAPHAAGRTPPRRARPSASSRSEAPGGRGSAASFRPVRRCRYAAPPSLPRAASRRGEASARSCEPPRRRSAPGLQHPAVRLIAHCTCCGVRP